MNPEEFKNAIDWAKKNPNDPKAIELRKRIENGMFNNELQAAGMKTFEVKAPQAPVQPPAPMVEEETVTEGAPEQGLMGKLGQRYNEGVGGFIENVLPGLAGDRTAQARAFLRPAGALGRGVGDVVSAGLETGFNLLPDVAKQKISEVAEPITKTVAPVVSTVMDKYNQFKERNPEAAQDLEDIVGVSELFGGALATKPVAPLAKGAIKGTAKAAAKAVPDTSGLSESLIANVNRINPTKRQEFKMQQGVSEEEWLRERGIIGTREQTVQQLADNFKAMRQNVDEALDKIPGTHRDNRVTVVADDSAEFARSVESPETNRMSQLAEKAHGVGLTTSEINEVKRFYERNIKTGYLKDPTKSSEAVQRATNRDSGIREALLEIADKNGFDNLRQINKEIQASKFLADEIAGKMEGQAANNLMSITDWIVATPGLAIDPTFLAGFGLKKLVSTEGARALAARALAGFPEAKSLPRADLDDITRRAQEMLKKQESIRQETQQAGILADELQKAGWIMGDNFIMETPISLTQQEQMLIRAAKNRDEQLQMARYILEQREQGKAVGKGFTIEDVDNVPILNPKKN